MGWNVYPHMRMYTLDAYTHSYMCMYTLDVHQFDHFRFYHTCPGSPLIKSTLQFSNPAALSVAMAVCTSSRLCIKGGRSWACIDVDMFVSYPGHIGFVPSHTVIRMYTPITTHPCARPHAASNPASNACTPMLMRVTPQSCRKAWRRGASKVPGSISIEICRLRWMGDFVLGFVCTSRSPMSMVVVMD